MSRPMCKSIRFLFLMGVIAWSIGCFALRPSVPGQDDEVVSSLSGLLVMECIDSGSSICTFDLHAGRQVRVVTPDCQGSCSEPSLSPAGQELLFTQGSLAGVDIWQVGIDGQGLRPFIQGEAAEALPIWSPDGKLVAYQIMEDPYTLDTPDGPFQLYRHSSLHVAGPNGTADRRLTRRDGDVLTYDWAPGSDRLVISACLEDLNQDGIIGDKDPERLYVIDLATGDMQAIFDNVDPNLSMHEPSWSPDGVHIAYIEGHGDPASYGDLVVVRVDDGFEVVRLDVSPSAEYAWSPSGNEIAYVELWPGDRVSYEDLFVFDLSTGDVTRLTDTSQYTVFGAWELNGITLSDPTWSPDGEYLAFVWRTGGKDYIVVASADGTRLSRVVGLGPGYHLLIAWGP